MVIEDASCKVLEYLKKQGQTNTFKLASELSIDRYRILNIVKKLEEKKAVDITSGIVNFLRFPKEEKKAAKKVEIKKAVPKLKKKVKKARVKPDVLGTMRAENNKLREKSLELEANKERQASIKNKKIREQAEQIESMGKTIRELRNIPPKIVRRTKVKKIPIKVKEYITKIKRVPVKLKKLKEQAEQIEELEKTIEKLKKKASAPPEIIKRTIIKKVPVKVKEKPKKEKIKPRKFRLPKISFSKLNKKIKELNVPEMLKK